MKEIKSLKNFSHQRDCRMGTLERQNQWLRRWSTSANYQQPPFINWGSVNTWLNFRKYGEVHFNHPGEGKWPIDLATNWTSHRICKKETFTGKKTKKIDLAPQRTIISWNTKHLIPLTYLKMNFNRLGRREAWIGSWHRRFWSGF